MGAVVDTVHANGDEISLILRKYPNCYVQIRSPLPGIESYVVIIPDETADSYYEFLADNAIAMSSTNFLNRLNSDSEFSRRMLRRIQKH